MGEKTSITKPKQPSVNYGSGFNNFTKTRKDTVIASREGWKAGMERRAKYNPRLRGVVNDQKKIDKKYSKSTETALSEMRSGDWDTDSSAAKLSKKEMEVLSVSDRLGLITIIANGFSVVDEDEQTLVRLLATAPASDAKQIISGLGSSNSTLLDRFENIMHGDEYKQYHKILNALYFQSMKPKEAANKMKSAKELPWSDPGFIKSLWTERYYYRHIKITDKGKIQFKYFYVKRTMGKEEQLVELDPFEMVAVRFYTEEPEAGAKEGEVKFMPAINFLALLAKLFRQEVGITADVLMTMSGIGAIASASSKGKKIIGVLQVAFGLTDGVIREFRGKISQSDEGKEFLKYWDMVTALVAIYSIGQLVGSIPGIFKNLRGKYTALRGKAIKNLDDAEVKSFEDSIENFLKKGEDAVEEAKAVGVKGSKGKVPAATKAAAKPGKIEIDDYVKTGHFTPKDEVTILNKYNQEYNKDIDIIVKQLKSRKGTARSTEEMALLIKNSAKPPKVIGRVSLKDYPGFAPHDVAWVLDPAELKGLSNTDIMRRCGWEDSYIKNILDLKPDKRPSIVINLIENPGKLKVPTWDFFQQKTKNMIDAQDKYLINNIKRVKGLDIDKIDTYFDILKKTSVEDVDKLPAHIQDFRKILELKFGNNTLFSGRGFTVTPAGKFGLREWLMAKPDVSFDLGKMKQDGFTIKQIKLGWE